ncbi:MAG: CidA/LrgA family protein [Colwellia sp.]
MKNVLYTFFAISISLLLGKLTNSLLPGLPASLYGMIIYAILLQLNLMSADKVSQANQWLIRHMGVCFIPAAIGIINHFQLMQQHGIAFIGIIFSSTLILLTVIGCLSERLFAKSPPHNDDSSAGNS